MRYRPHDYSSAAGYFVTFATRNRRPLLGAIVNASFRASAAGRIVEDVWRQLPVRYPTAQCDAFQLMPDHVHCIVVLLDARVAGIPDAGSVDLPAVMHWLKGVSSRRINAAMGTSGKPVWQVGYTDRVIRSERELEKFRQYTLTNPLRYSLRESESQCQGGVMSGG